MDFISNVLNVVSSKKDQQFFIDLFKTMPSHLMADCRICSAGQGTTLIYAGDPCETVFILVSGTIKITSEFLNGIIYSFAKVYAPSFLGETESFSGFSYYRATVACETDCHYVAMSKNQFIKWMKSSNDALFTITTSITKKIAQQSARDRTFLFSSGESRLAYQFTQNYENNAQNDVCRIKIPRYQLADEICLSIKTVNRCIAKLREKNFFTQEGRVIIINKEQYQRLLNLLKED
jgi:CRP/FNR family cyclic AMP-dependent transcriptional regulator